MQLEFRGAQLSSDGGLLVMRELDDALELSDIASVTLRNKLRAKNSAHQLDGLFRQSVFGCLAGYEDVAAADRLALDPAMRQIVSGSVIDAQAASAAQIGLSRPRRWPWPRTGRRWPGLNGQWIDGFHDHNGLKYIVLAMDC